MTRRMRAREAIARARELGVSPAAIEVAHRLGVPLWPVHVALEAALSGRATEIEVERFLELLTRPASARAESC